MRRSPFISPRKLATCSCPPRQAAAAPLATPVPVLFWKKEPAFCGRGAHAASRCPSTGSPSLNVATCGAADKPEPGLRPCDVLMPPALAQFAQARPLPLRQALACATSRPHPCRRRQSRLCGRYAASPLQSWPVRQARVWARYNGLGKGTWCMTNPATGGLPPQRRCAGRYEPAAPLSLWSLQQASAAVKPPPAKHPPGQTGAAVKRPPRAPPLLQARAPLLCSSGWARGRQRARRAEVRRRQSRGRAAAGAELAAAAA